MDQRKWQVTDSSYVIDTPYLRLRRDCIELPDGTVINDYFVRESRGYVIVFAMRADGRVLLVRQYKHGVGKVLLELVAGMIDADETPAQAAQRELREETGYDCGSMEHVRTFVADPTNATTVAHLFFARGVYEAGAQQLDITENIAVELATPVQLREMLRDGRIESVAHVAAIYFLLDRFAAFSEE